MDSPITVDIPHQLGAAEARSRIDQGFNRLAEQISGSGSARVSRKWDGDRMTFSVGALGQLIHGQLQVMPDLVRIEVLLPGFLGAMASVVAARLRTQGQTLLQRLSRFDAWRPELLAVPPSFDICDAVAPRFRPRLTSKSRGRKSEPYRARAIPLVTSARGGAHEPDPHLRRPIGSGACAAG